MARWSRLRRSEDESFDAATCVYLFHEVPPRVRRWWRARSRVLPGGVLVLADPIQSGDHPDLDRMLEFPRRFS